MIVDRVYAFYEEEARQRRPKRGNPSGSEFGGCAAQLQQLHYPELSRPEPFSGRGLMRLQEGDSREAWWGQEIERAYPGLSGLAQEPFYFPVPLQPGEAEEVRRRLAWHQLWGEVRREFVPPSVLLVEGRPKIHLAADKRLGFVLDPAAGPDGTLYAPTYVDRVIVHPEWGVVVIEKKAMSNYGFSRVLRADPGYKLRAQLAGEAEALGAAVCLVAYRSETAHIAEILYRQEAEAVRVELRLGAGTREVYTAPRVGAPLDRPLPADVDWEYALVQSPWDPALLAQIRARIRRVVLAVPPPGRVVEGWRVYDWDREYGPEFGCVRCVGVGARRCGYCAGSGTGKKGDKPCGHCKGTGRRPCGVCGGTGQLDEAPLPAFPCGYCPVRGSCYPMARRAFVRVRDGSRPEWLITRGDFEASGIRVSPPEPPQPPEEPEEEAPEEAPAAPAASEEAGAQEAVL